MFGALARAPDLLFEPGDAQPGGVMRVGMAVVMQNLGKAQPDHEVYREEKGLADLAEPLGFDSFFTVEHHFSDYMIVPDVLQLLTWVAARTQRILLGTAVKVLPWQDPVRVAEQVAMLDALSEGRVLLGVGRGTARLEFEGLRVPIHDSRERFEEAAQVLVKALEGEPFSHEGRFFQIPQIAIRPRPRTNFDGRIFGAAVSPASAEIIARLGFGVFIIPQRPWEETAKDMVRHAEIRRQQGLAPMAPITLCWVHVAETDDEAMANARRYMGNYWFSADEHYGLTAGQHQDLKSYEFFARAGDLARAASREDVVENYVGYHVAGSPARCIEKIRFIQQKVGMDHFVGVFKYGGMPQAMAEKSLRLFAAQVLPVVQREL
jgi:alkanesulfonate monooxygenase SsuD/methylene tetrahydromethanopterin reductase-like flavin-dependent oxidoreductase (luciferase family)